MNQITKSSNGSTSDFLTLTCPTCGAKLKLGANVNLLVCANCGNEHMVHRDGAAIYLGPIAQDVQQIRVGVDKTAAELAVIRLKKEIAEMDPVIEEAKRRNYSQFVRPIEGEALFISGIVLSLIAAVFSIPFALLIHSPVILIAPLGFVAITVWLIIALSQRGTLQSQQVEKIKAAELQRIYGLRDAKIAALQKNHEIAST